MQLRYDGFASADILMTRQRTVDYQQLSNHFFGDHATEKTTPHPISSSQIILLRFHSNLNQSLSPYYPSHHQRCLYRKCHCYNHHLISSLSINSRPTLRSQLSLQSSLLPQNPGQCQFSFETVKTKKPRACHFISLGLRPY